MTSSLVGSEMCIRDSQMCCAYVAGIQATRGAKMRFQFDWDPSQWRRYELCLLYTSDAADDM
eukprot:388958-Prorocentrum_lima.AAC.1